MAGIDARDEGINTLGGSIREATSVEIEEDGP